MRPTSFSIAADMGFRQVTAGLPEPQTRLWEARREPRESLSIRGRCGIKGIGTKNPWRKGRGYRGATGKKDDTLKAFKPVNGKGFRENKDDV